MPVTWSDENLRAALQQHFGFSGFREGQAGPVREVLGGGDALVVMPTGSGKSLCYQFPALVMDGTAVILSPLIALMKDQVDGLARRGIAAAYINSTLTASEMSARLRDMRAGRLKLVYIAPERLGNARFLADLQKVQVSLIAVDEAHCVSQWGHDFRPDYLRIHELVAHFPKARLMALTATATPRVRDDIIRHAGFGGADRPAPQWFVTGFARPNLRLMVNRVSNHDDKRRRLLSVLETHGAGLIYCSTRKQVEKVHGMLKRRVDGVGMYHAGLSDAERAGAMDRFMNRECPVMVATNAFGMGVDRDDLRFVVHWDLPGSLEAYYQEIGRAGRDGADAWCELLYNFADTRTHEFFLEGANPSPETVREVLAYVRRHVQMGPVGLMPEDLAQAFASTRNPMAVRSAVYLLERAGCLVRQSAGQERGMMVDVVPDADPEVLQRELNLARAKRARDEQRLERMMHYVQSRQCRHAYILEYFGEAATRLACDMCDQCGSHPALPRRAPTEAEWKPIQIVLSCVARLSHEFGVNRIVQILVGSKAQAITRAGLHQHRNYGMLHGQTEASVKSLLEALVADGSLELRAGKYPTVGITARGREVAWKRIEPRLSLPHPGAAPVAAEATGSSRDPASGAESFDAGLFEMLRAWRKERARAAGLAPFMVFADRTLKDMARLQPDSEAALAQINGVGPAKLKSFGDEVLAVVDAWRGSRDA